MPQEIEVKYLVREMPDNLSQYRSEKIRQGYLTTAESENVVRVRQKGGKYYLTAKSAGLMSRLEAEIETSLQQFEALWPLTEGRRVEKTRFYIEYKKWLIELDIFEGDLTGLAIAEVEFDSEEAVTAFLPPAWFGDEVTWDRRYHNSRLAMYGLPEK